MHDGGHGRRADVGAQQRGRLLARRAAPPPRGRAPRRTPSRPARSSRRARSGSCALLEDAVAGRDRVDPAAALDELLLDVGAVRGDSTCARGCARTNADVTFTSGLRERLLRAQAELDLVRERRRRTGRARPASRTCRCAARPARGARPLPAGGRARTSQRAARRVPGAVRVEPPVAREAPGAVDEHADADALALAVAERLDAAVLRRHRLVAPTTARASAYSAPAASAASTACRAKLPHRRGP